MTSLIPSRGYQPTGLRDVDLASTRLPKAVQHMVDAETARGLARAQRVNAAGFVAEVGLSWVDMLGLMESAIARRDPVSAERAAAIVEDFTYVARVELRRMAREF
jgi:hypothetical protein